MHFSVSITIGGIFMYKVIIGVIVVAVIAIVGFMIIDPRVNVTRVDDTSLVSSESELEGTIKVTIEGEVNKANTYSLPEGSTMGDLIEAAGGVTSVADPRCYYVEYVVEKNSTYYIPGLYDYSDVCNNSEVSKVNINDDDAETLMQVKVITASLASSIVSYRNSNGNFQTLEELQNVYRIGPSTYKQIRDYVILHA